MNANLRNFALWVIIVLLLLALFTLFQNPGRNTGSTEIPFSQLLSDVDNGRVRDVTIQGSEVRGVYTNGSTFQTYAPSDPSLVQRAGGKALGFGKSRAKLLTEAHGRVTFEDVAGVDEAKLDLQEIVEFLRDPAKFQRLGGRIPRGVLLVGPPGRWNL